MFNFTPQERKVFIFLLATALIGSAIAFLSKKYAPVKSLLVSYQNIGKVSLNEADKELLMSIKGIGEKLAQRIIEYRTNQQGFRDIEELKNVRGITLYRYEKIKESFTIRQ